MPVEHPTLAQFLVDRRRRHPGAPGDLDPLVLDVARACRTIAERVALGALRDELDDPDLRPTEHRRGEHLLVLDPLDGASEVDTGASTGSIFSILPAPGAPTPGLLPPGTAQVCAGYVLYGPATVLVLTLGRGVHTFTLHPALGEFVLTREAVRMPRRAGEVAVDVSNRRTWEPAVRRYVDECLAGRSGPRHRDVTLRWSASLAAATHRVLTRGGVLLCPRDTTEPAGPGGRRRLRDAAGPVAFLVEQAGGAASTGRERVLDVVPSDPHQRVPLVAGAGDEVALVERYHREHNDHPYDSPLYGERGLFRVAGG